MTKSSTGYNLYSVAYSCRQNMQFSYYKMYPYVLQKIISPLPHTIPNTRVQDCTFYLISRKIVLLYNLVICEKVYLNLVQLLSTQYLLHCRNKIVKRLSLKRWLINIQHENVRVLWWSLLVYAKLIQLLLIST